MMLVMALAFLLSLANVALVQPALSEPGFDPKPVEITEPTNQRKRTVTAMDLLELREVKSVRISPDGRCVAFVVYEPVYKSNGYRTGLFVVDAMAGGVLRSLGSAGPPDWDEVGEALLEPPKWSPDSQSLAFRYQHMGKWQVWKWERSRGEVMQLTDVEEDVKRFDWSPDGKKIVFVTEKIDPVNLKEVAQRGILYEDSLYEHSVQPWDKKSVLDAVASTAEKQTHEWVKDLVSGEQRTAGLNDLRFLTDSGGHLQQSLQFLDKSESDLKTELGGELVSAKLSPDGLHVSISVYLTDAKTSESGRYSLFLLTRGQAKPVELTPETYYIADFWWSKDGKRLYFESSSGNGKGLKLYVIRLPAHKADVLTQTANYLSNFSVSDDGKMIACLSESSTRPPEVSLIEVASGKMRLLANVNPEFENVQLSPATRIEWKNKYGDTSFGHLVKPPNYEHGKRYPLIVITYRSSNGFLRGGVGNEYPIQLFAANGFIVLSFDAGRLPNHKPGDFDSAMLRWYKPLASLEAALALIDSMGLVDAQRCGITGLSFGAEIVQFALTNTNLFQAAISSGIGTRDQIAFYITGRSKYWRQRFANWGLETWPDAPTSVNWQKFSTAMKADRVQAPWLVHVADSELVPGMQMITTLERLGKTIEVFIYANEFHIKNQPKHIYEIWQRNLDWFNFWLQGKKDVDPLKIEQYRRWEKYSQAESSKK